MIKPIVKEPAPLLHRKARPVKELTSKIQTLIDAMIETMHAAEGVGLAANQIGSDLDILVASPDGEPGKELVLMNARILRRSGQIHAQEGCLSLPGIFAEVTRAADIAAQGLDREGKTKLVQTSGLLARILQHETDHLVGRLYLDHLNLLERKQLFEKYQSLTDTLRQIDLNPGTPAPRHPGA